MSSLLQDQQWKSEHLGVSTCHFDLPPHRSHNLQAEQMQESLSYVSPSIGLGMSLCQLGLYQMLGNCKKRIKHQQIEKTARPLPVQAHS